MQEEIQEAKLIEYREGGHFKERAQWWKRLFFGP